MTTKVVQVAIQPEDRVLWAQFRDSFGDVSGMLPPEESVLFTSSDPDVVNVRPQTEADGVTERPLLWDAIPLDDGTATITATVGTSSLSVDVEVLAGELIPTMTTVAGKPLIAANA